MCTHFPFLGFYICQLVSRIKSQHRHSTATCQRQRLNGKRMACGLLHVACALWLMACGSWFVVCGLWLVGARRRLRLCFNLKTLLLFSIPTQQYMTTWACDHRKPVSMMNFFKMYFTTSNVNDFIKTKMATIFHDHKSYPLNQLV